MDDLSRTGAAQPKRFDPARAARLDDPERFNYLPPHDIIELLDLPPGAQLVDFGAGTGMYAIAIARARPDVSIFALDEQRAMLDRLRANVSAAQIVTIDALEPEQSGGLVGRVERILALNVLHELGDAALAGMRDLLASDGRALVVDWNAAIERQHGPPAAHVYAVEEARERLASVGLRTLTTKLFDFHYALLCVCA